jgi:hypothetical protein
MIVLLLVVLVAFASCDSILVLVLVGSVALRVLVHLVSAWHNVLYSLYL